MGAFLDLIKSSAVVQGFIALLLIGGIVYQVVVGQQPSETLLIMANVVLGFYFGTKTQQAIESSVAKASQRKGG